MVPQSCGTSQHFFRKLETEACRKKKLPEDQGKTKGRGEILIQIGRISSLRRMLLAELVPRPNAQASPGPFDDVYQLLLRTRIGVQDAAVAADYRAPGAG